MAWKRCASKTEQWKHASPENKARGVNPFLDNVWHIISVEWNENTKDASTHQTDNLPESACSETEKQFNIGRRDWQDETLGKNDVHPRLKCYVQTCQ